MIKRIFDSKKSFVLILLTPIAFVVFLCGIFLNAPSAQAKCSDGNADWGSCCNNSCPPGSADWVCTNIGAQCSCNLFTFGPECNEGEACGWGMDPTNKCCVSSYTQGYSGDSSDCGTIDVDIPGIGLVTLPLSCSCLGKYCGTCPGGGGDGDDYSSSCTLYSIAGDNLEVNFSIGLEGDYDAYTFNYGDGQIDCDGAPCSIYDKPDWPNFSHTYGSAGNYTATVDLYYSGSWTGSCSDDLNVLEVTCPGPVQDTCQIRNLECPTEALVNTSFPVTYDFLQPEDPLGVWPKVNRQGWMTDPFLPPFAASSRPWCDEGEALVPSCWYTEQKQFTCPDIPATYTFSVQCDVIDPAMGLGCMYDSFDDKKTCSVQCVDSLTPCSPDTSQVCCDNAASNVDATATKGSAPGATCGGASCYLDAAIFSEDPLQAPPPFYQASCCGDDTNEYFIAGTSSQSCDGTSACCNNPADYVSGGQCRTACNQAPTPTITPSSSSQAPQIQDQQKTKLIGSGYKTNPDDYVVFRRPRPQSPEADAQLSNFINKISGSILTVFKKMFRMD